MLIEVTTGQLWELGVNSYDTIDDFCDFLEVRNGNEAGFECGELHVIQMLGYEKQFIDYINCRFEGHVIDGDNFFYVINDVIHDFCKLAQK